MEWFTEAHADVLRDVAEGVMKETLTLQRVVGAAYTTVATLKCQIVPPGYPQHSEKTIAPSHLRGVPLGTMKVPVGSDVRAKDRALVNGRLFDVVAPLTGRTIEIRLKFLVREIHQPERELYLALKPTGYDGATNTEALPELMRVLPIPFIVDKGTDIVTEREGSGAEIARLKQLEAFEIGPAFFSEANLERLLYCLVVNSDVTPTAEQGRDRVFPRYRFNGSPSFENHAWGSLFPWCVALVEER